MPGTAPFPGEIIGYRRSGVPIRLIAGGDPTNDLSGQLETRRASLVSANRELLSGAAAANNGAGRDLTADEEGRYQANRTEIRSLGERLDDLADEHAREQRAAAARADGTTTTVDSGRGATGVQVTREPQTYERYSPHSYFGDLLRASLKRGDGDGGLGAAEERLGQHRAELRVELPARRERRSREASQRLDAHLQERLSVMPSRYRRREERMVERWLGLGLPTFERRAGMSQAAGDGGYFIPPLWLVDEYVEYLRAGRVLANLMHSMPLPAGTNSINLPIITLGSAVGAQPADGDAVGSRDMTDSYVNALVKTVAGQEDASMQLLDMSPLAGGMDRLIFKDLTADHAMQVDGQVMLGSGSNGQIGGLYPTGTITGGSTPGIIVNGVTDTTDQWTGSATRTDFYSAVGKLASQIGRKRFTRMTDVVTNEAVWNSFATASDGNKRPLVPPTSPYNAAAVFEDDGAVEGPVGSILARRWHVDNNIPLTFGGTTAPSMGTLSAGHTALTDGSGGASPAGPTYTPLIGGVFDDMLLFEGEVRTRVLQEILSDTLQIRFQLYNYMAFIPNRYQNGGVVVSYGNANSVGTAAGALSTDTNGGLVGF